MNLAKTTRQIMATVVVFLLLLAILPIAVGAQSSAPVNPEDLLPEGLQSETTTSTAAEGEGSTATNNRTQDFITGLAVGAAVGIIVGGGTIWFTKKG